MTEQQTIDSRDDMNEIIAVFDGWEFRKGDPNHHCKYCFAGDEPCNPAVDRFIKDRKVVFHYELKYDSSWNQLMPVWFKCQHLGADMGYRFKKYYEEFHAGIDYQSIIKCHRACYDFIIWYNKSQTHNNDIQS